MMVKTETNKIVRCSVVGDGLVGKTTLARKFAQHKVSESYVATVFDNFAGVYFYSFLSKVISLLHTLIIIVTAFSFFYFGVCLKFNV